MQETQLRSLGQEDPLEKEMVTHSSILAWRIPWTEKPGRLQSMGPQRVRHDWATSLSLSKALVVVVQSLSRVQLFQSHGPQHARVPCPSPTPRACSNSCLLSWWCHPTISSSVIPFSSCPQSFPVSGAFPMSWFFSSCGQSIGASKNIYRVAIIHLKKGTFWRVSCLCKLNKKNKQ